MPTVRSVGRSKKHEFPLRVDARSNRCFHQPSLALPGSRESIARQSASKMNYYLNEPLATSHNHARRTVAPLLLRARRSLAASDKLAGRAFIWTRRIKGRGGHGSSGCELTPVPPRR